MMTMLEDRRRALEDKYILDFERSFKTRERRNRMLAEWAARMLRKDPDIYVAEIADANIRAPHDDDLAAKIGRDFKAAGQTANEETVRRKMHDLMFEAAEALAREDAADSH